MSQKRILPRQSLFHTLNFRIPQRAPFYLPSKTIKQAPTVTEGGQGSPKVTFTSPFRVLYTCVHTDAHTYLNTSPRCIMRNIPHGTPETQLESFVVLIRRVLSPACFSNLISSVSRPPHTSPPAPHPTPHSLSSLFVSFENK